MKSVRIIGLCLVLLGVLMLFFGASLFGARSNQLAPWVSVVGKYSFILWLPIVITGITLRIIAKRKL